MCQKININFVKNTHFLGGILESKNKGNNMRAERISANTNNQRMINPLTAAAIGGTAAYALKYAMPLTNYEQKKSFLGKYSNPDALGADKILKVLAKDKRPTFYFVAIGAIISAAIVYLGNMIIASGSNKSR